MPTGMRAGLASRLRGEINQKPAGLPSPEASIIRPAGIVVRS